MHIFPLSALKDNYIWVIQDDTNVVCVDPGDARPILQYAKEEGLKLTDVLITHHHPDHTGGIRKIMQTFSEANVYGPNDERIPSVKPVNEDDVVQIGDYNFQILSTPGHTRTHICFLEASRQWLFCGDTLFSAGCGRVFEGTYAQLHQSLLTLRNLPDSTKVYCGHEYTRNNLRFAETVEPNNDDIKSYIQKLKNEPDKCSLPSTIALEKKINPFLRTDQESLKIFAEKEGVPTDNPLAIFKRLRQKKDLF